MSYQTQTGVPRTETQRSTQVSDVSMDKGGDPDMLVNNLVYEQPKALSLAVARTYKKSFFQTRSFTAASRSTTAIANWNTGTAYVDPANSYLSFNVTVVGANGTFGQGSAMNLINEVRIKSRSGAELDRLQMANLWSKYDSRWTRSDDHITTLGSVEGFGVTVTAATATKFCIPLACLSPFFRPMKKQLIPPQLAAGLIVELVFENFATAWVDGTTSITSYNIDDLEFQLDCVDLTDDTQRTLNMQSADNGLEYSYERIHTAVTQQTASTTQLVQQITKAVSQACFATTIVKPAAQALATDNMNSLTAFPISQYQYRLGALYFPHQAVTNANDGKEAYLIGMQVYDKMKHKYAPSSVTVGEFVTTDGMMSASFEKDTALNMSGLPINNSRSLELDVTYTGTGPAAAQDVITFLQYCVVARSFIDNTAVAI